MKLAVRRIVGGRSHTINRFAALAKQEVDDEEMDIRPALQRHLYRRCVRCRESCGRSRSVKITGTQVWEEKIYKRKRKEVNLKEKETRQEVDEHNKLKKQPKCIYCKRDSQV